MKSNIKILISCHKPSEYVKNDVLQPIQVGSKNAGVRLPDILHDDVGDNISELNPMYCELTAQYWAWKNLDADYYGFFHYRRYLDFNSTGSAVCDPWGNVVEDFFSPQVLEKHGISETQIEKVVKGSDIILPEAKDIKKMPHMGQNMREQYEGSGYLHSEDLDLLMAILKEKYADYFPYAEQYIGGHITCLNNMFVMRKDIFFDFCAWEFDILEEFCRRSDMSDYCAEALRTPGHLAERLVNIYCMRAMDKGAKIKRLHTLVFSNTNPQPEMKPAFESNNVAIAFSANEYYVPYLSTALQSFMEHCTSDYNYDVIVMHRDISPKSQMQLKRQLSALSNISLRFYEVTRFGEQFNHLFLRGHFALETYFRLLMPEILPDYQKILYLDSDIIIESDIGSLYNTDISGYLLAACHDADTAGLYNGYDPHKKPYMDNVLKIEKPYEYFQAGVILFNLEEFRKQYTSDEMLEFAASYKWQLLDQDVLNYLAQNQYKPVDMAWNVMTDWRDIRVAEIISRAPKYLRDEYMTARQSPKIVHYAGPDKPWQHLSIDCAEYFWKYARKTIYYEILLQRFNANTAGILSKISKKFKSSIMKSANSLFPPYTARREAVKAIKAKLWG